MDAEHVIEVRGKRPVWSELPGLTDGPLLRVRVGQVRIVDTNRRGTNRQARRECRRSRQRIDKGTIRREIRTTATWRPSTIEHGCVDERIGKLKTEKR